MPFKSQNIDLLATKDVPLNWLLGTLVISPISLVNVILNNRVTLIAAIDSKADRLLWISNRGVKLSTNFCSTYIKYCYFN